MKIAIASLGKNLNSKVDSRFGRCPFFLIVDSDTNKFEVIENTAGKKFQGAGISAAQLIVNKTAESVIAGNFGPKAVSVLSTSGIKIFGGIFGITAQEAIEKYKLGELKEMSDVDGIFVE